MNIENILSGMENIPNVNVSRRGFLGAVGVATLGLLSNEAEAKDSRSSDLRGSKKSLEKQRRMFKVDDLSMLRNKDLILNSPYRKSKKLVDIETETDCYYFTSDAPFGYLTRPYVYLFLQRFSGQFQDDFKERLDVKSLTRSFEYQNRLREINGNATLPQYSPHVRAAGIDFTYKNMDAKQKAWMRNRLTALERADVLEATEEKAQATFHVMPFKSYTEHVRNKLRMNKHDFQRYYERTTGGVLY